MGFATCRPTRLCSVCTADQESKWRQQASQCKVILTDNRPKKCDGKCLLRSEIPCADCDERLRPKSLLAKLIEERAKRVDPREGLEIMRGPGDLTVGKLEFNPVRTVNERDKTIVRIPKYTGPTSYPMGWECPRCHGVWGPAVMGCNRCNAQTVSGQVEIDPELVKKMLEVGRAIPPR